jgi:hypothetical protein
LKQDAWANAHRIPLEAEKAKAGQGHYLHPELFDHAGEPSITELLPPRPKQRQQQYRQRQLKAPGARQRRK